MINIRSRICKNNNSIIYNIDPRTKILVSIVISVLAFLSKSTISLLIIFVSCVLFTKLSKISVIKIFKKNFIIIIISAFSVIVNMFFLFDFNILLRLLSIILINSTMISTISLNNISYSIEKILSFAKIVKINPRNIALSVNITIRFVYIFFNEFKRNCEARRSRGADFFNKNLVKKIKLYFSILVPIFVSSMKRADEFAQALETKAYDLYNKYTTLIEFKFNKNDFFVCFITFLLGIAVTLCEILIKK